jgi:hypothetical protein
LGHAQSDLYHIKNPLKKPTQKTHKKPANQTPKNPQNTLFCVKIIVFFFFVYNISMANIGNIFDSNYKRSKQSNTTLIIILATIILITITPSAYAAIKGALTPEAQVGNCDGTLCVNDVQPGTVSSGGGQTLTLVGSGFPDKFGANNYVQSAASGAQLVADFDGIDNTNSGDLNHDTTAQNWTDIKNNISIPLLNDPTGEGWQDRGYKFEGNKFFEKLPVPSQFPTGTGARTFEVTFITPSTFNGSSSTFSGPLVSYGGGCGNMGRIAYYWGTNPFMFWGGCNVGNDATFPATSDLWAKSKLNTISFSYNGLSDMAAYVNGEPQTISNDLYLPLNTGNQHLIFGGNYTPDKVSSPQGTISEPVTGFTLVSFRLYSGKLSSTEITANRLVDQQRFLAPPTVTVGGEPCLNVIAASATEIQCQVPAHADGSVDVVLNYNGKTVTKQNAVTYYSPSLTSVSPSTALKTGGAEIVLNGTNFPYAATSDYVQDGLVGHWDAINNIGLGDKYHSNTTQVWTDLIHGEKLDLYDDPTGAGWNANNYTFAGTAFFGAEPVPAAFPINNADRTIETTYMIPSEASIADNTVISNYGDSKTVGGCDNLLTRQMFTRSNNVLQFWPLGGCGNGGKTDFRIAMTKQMKTAGTINTTTTKWHEYKDNPESKSYVNGTAYYNMVSDPTHAALTTGSCRFSLGALWGCQGGAYYTSGYATGFKMNTYRIYSRLLTSAEIAYNANLDQLRFKNPPVVNIGGTVNGDVINGGVNCGSLVVISKTQIKCKLSTGLNLATGLTDVHFDWSGFIVTIPNAIDFVADTESVVSSISTGAGYSAVAPLFGSNILTIKGKNLDTVDSVKIGGNNCPIINGGTTEQITCTVPAASNSGIVDVTYHTTIGNRTSSLTSAFEYVGATANPVSFHVENDGGVIGFDGIAIDPAWDGVSEIDICVPNAYSSNFDAAGVNSFVSQTVVGNDDSTVCAAGAGQKLIRFIAYPDPSYSQLTVATVNEFLEKIKFGTGSSGPSGIGSADESVAAGSVSIKLLNSLW